jgi:hypothetical protein
MNEKFDPKLSARLGCNSFRYVDRLDSKWESFHNKSLPKRSWFKNVLRSRCHHNSRRLNSHHHHNHSSNVSFVKKHTKLEKTEFRRYRAYSSIFKTFVNQTSINSWEVHVSHHTFCFLSSLRLITKPSSWSNKRSNDET